MDFTLLPKIDLHLHFDCSLSYEAVAQLAPEVTHDAYMRNFVAPDKCASLADFLTRPPRMVALLQTEAALRLAVRDLFDQLQRDGTLYAELRYAPLLHTAQGLAPAAIVQIVESETAACSAQTGIEAGIILCTLRHFSAAQSQQTAELAAQFRGSRVVGFDIAGDESLPLAPHIEAFRYARAQQIQCTAHGGESREAAGPGSVREVLDQLQPQRIGHGVRSSEDAGLVAELVQRRIHLEVCPSCNVQIDIYPTYADHPLDQLYRAGVALNVNTDARATTYISLSQEYQRVHNTFGWGREAFLATNIMAAQASFAPANIKENLITRLKQAYSNQPNEKNK